MFIFPTSRGRVAPHDLDVKLVNVDLSVHGIETPKILNEKGIYPTIVEAIVMHNEFLIGKKGTQNFSTPLQEVKQSQALLL
jgi:predicted hydrolase (HD superfamily)